MFHILPCNPDVTFDFLPISSNLLSSLANCAHDGSSRISCPLHTCCPRPHSATLGSPDLDSVAFQTDFSPPETILVPQTPPSVLSPTMSLLSGLLLLTRSQELSVAHGTKPSLTTALWSSPSHHASSSALFCTQICLSPLCASLCVASALCFCLSCSLFWTALS